jgi:hypothetical protein
MLREHEVAGSNPVIPTNFSYPSEGLDSSKGFHYPAHYEVFLRNEYPDNSDYIVIG